MWVVGKTLQPLVKPPITEAHLVKYAEASGDNNPIHLDPKFAEEAGFKSVIVHGMLSMAFLADHLGMNFPTSDYRLGKIRTRFRRVTFPGDVLSCEGTVRRELPDGGFLVALSARNQDGEITTDGEAEVYPRVASGVVGQDSA